ncbi:hypothetical protein CORC01_06739 [Colletotrichum orchidophilum]|uniref:Uncharacterized protein n=1 Tax=Colletotrichum orchidophilum TaxID=1209926 RepID=A0A1G4B964_9PEZI|nr:uncharacterized protein CORC01_06739 [Colletotrichum orchidophilum]OHE97876.1 hypothetical protein CORC01_06739 [Colletotrichum orchidophilum]
MDIEQLIRNPPFKLTDADIRALRGQSETFQPHTWDEVQKIIGQTPKTPLIIVLNQAAGEMGQLNRAPQDLRNYIVWLAEVGQSHGSVLEFVRREKLHWQRPIVAQNSVPFADPHDWKILWNDWPYGLANGIMHLVLWSKAKILVDPETGLPTKESARLIEAFLARTFGGTLSCVPGENLLWFKQKAAWQSVKALDHIHIMLRGVQEDKVEKLIGHHRSQTLQVLARKGLLISKTEPRISSKMS